MKSYEYQDIKDIFNMSDDLNLRFDELFDVIHKFDVDRYGFDTAALNLIYIKENKLDIDDFKPHDCYLFLLSVNSRILMENIQNGRITSDELSELTIVAAKLGDSCLLKSEIAKLNRNK